MPHFDPTIYRCDSVTIRYRISKPDEANCINGSLDIIIAGHDSEQTIRFTLHDTQTKEPYKRDFIKITLEGGVRLANDHLTTTDHYHLPAAIGSLE